MRAFPFRRRNASRLARGCLAAFAAGRFLLCSRTALRRVALRRARRTGLLAAATRRTGRVGDLRGALLRHTLVLQCLVLLLVLHVRALVGHEPLLSDAVDSRAAYPDLQEKCASFLVIRQ